MIQDFGEKTPWKEVAWKFQDEDIVIIFRKN